MLVFLQILHQIRIIIYQLNLGKNQKNEKYIFDLKSLLGAVAMTIIFVVIELIILFIGVTLFYDKNNLFRKIFVFVG